AHPSRCRARSQRGGDPRRRSRARRSPPPSMRGRRPPRRASRERAARAPCPRSGRAASRTQRSDCAAGQATRRPGRSPSRRRRPRSPSRGDRRNPRRKGRSPREPRAPGRASTGRAGSRFGENTRRMPPFSKVLVANRGEIAVRVFRTLRELGIGCVGIYSEADRGRAHVRAADEAYLVGPGPAAESYLRGDVLVETALRAGAQAVHPGYGFLAENAAFARMVQEAGLTWIGPPPDAIELMGTKTAARRLMRDAGVPIIPGAVDPVRSPEEVAALGDEIGYPLIIKAAAGGGGKGMEIVRGPGDAERALEAATRQGERYFADPAVYVERYLEDPRHVEVQVLADAHGNAIHLGERDCTIQRRHQKLVEETPSPAVDHALRERIGRIAVDAARAAGYRSAGTVEGLLTPEGEYFFMEMNTRIQVEHTVTEAVTGLDLVREQILVAAGEPLSLAQDDVVLRGHAIECRINAEDVAMGFLPAPGRITAYREPAGPGVRVDSGIEAGDEVSRFYDPMIAKLIVHDVDRARAIGRMTRALAEFRIAGTPTLLGFHRALLEHPCFRAGETCDGIVES